MDDAPPKSSPPLEKSKQVLPTAFPQAVLTVDHLLPLIQFKKVSQPLRVRGRVEDVGTWQGNGFGYCYGGLVGANWTLPFRVPLAAAPYDGEDIIIAGVLTVTKDFKVQLQGDIEGRWQSLHREPQEAIPKRTRSVQTLAKFMEHHPVKSIGFLVSGTGWGDLCSAANLPHLAACHRESAHFGDEVQFVQALDRLLKKNVAAVVVARGGGEKLITIGNSSRVAKALIETGLPYYTALGHFDNLHLLDRHSDESFIAPTDVGHRIRNTEEELGARKAAQAESARLRGQLSEVKTELTKKEAENQRASDQNVALEKKLGKRETLVWALVGTSIALLVAVLLLWFQAN
ncbi:hypothetical protein ACN9MB_13575 [Dyella kyungheensis]|uniref:exodeoxyribonuclease VII large subunit n=1 Tax=Dyella kyungheensis TaxID=1242174 RepID=UPI003CF88B2D